ncbi:MAG: DUF2971 domain-containing protein [Bacteroidales bacterium]|nr:DUF2971 domain-containing protein [Bacteroidales bacterium]
MNPVSIRDTSFDELELPEVIYKYRSWTNPFHLEVISKKVLYMASPSEFTDPHDCKNPIRYDLLTDKDIFNIYLYHSKKDHKNWSREKHRSFAREWLKNTPLKNPQYVSEMQEEYFRDFHLHFGVLSLTANPSNDQMWTSYSENHQGFCIGFNTVLLFDHLGGGGIVNYYDTLPIIRPAPLHSYEQQHILQVFSKLRQWEYEQEYRTHKFYPNGATRDQRLISVPPQAFKEIIFGNKMPDPIKEQILLSIPDDLGHLLLKEENSPNS